MSVFSDFLDGVWSDIKNLFTSAEHVFIAFASSLIHSIAANGGQVLVDAAVAAVAAAEAAGGTGAEKLASAQAAVIATLKAAGVTVVTNAVNGAIEAAVAELKASQKPAA